MSVLQTLRNTRWLVRLVLAVFALFVGAAIASPMVKPPAGQMVCSGMGGMKLVMDGQDTPDRLPSAGMDCPLCAPVLAPPAPARLGFERPDAPGHGLKVPAVAPVAGLTGAPLPPRGPPLRH